jgi:hypothetical protein
MRKSVAPYSRSKLVAKRAGSQKHRDPHRRYLPHVAETRSLRLQFVTLKTGRVRNLEVCT